MGKYEVLFEKLYDYIYSIEKSFLRIPYAFGDISFENDVKAYCVLSYAALEHYFEEIAIGIMKDSIDIWFSKGELTKPLLSLVSSTQKSIEIDGDTIYTSSQEKMHDLQRVYLQEIKRDYSKQVQKNHGASPKHIINLLYRIFIELNFNDPKINSLAQLANERGNYAHTGHSSIRILNPVDAKNYVDDCLLISLDLCESAEKMFDS